MFYHGTESKVIGSVVTRETGGCKVIKWRCEWMDDTIAVTKTKTMTMIVLMTKQAF